MAEPFIGSEALAAGKLSRYQLRTRYYPLHQGIYVANNLAITASIRAKACWLRSRRRGILAGFSASSLQGAKWIDPARPAAIIDKGGNRRPTPGVEVFADSIEDDEICVIDGIPVSVPERTAFDLASRYPTGIAVAAIDALAQATDVKIADIEQLMQRYRGRRGIRAARATLQLVDPGAQSPKETWLRLLLLRAGLPRPQTQIPVRIEEGGRVIAYLDLGWDDIMVAVEYDGDQHRTDRRQYVKDIRRWELLERLGWLVVRVVAEDHPDNIIQRVRAARARRA
jgi:hypothetical protein